MRPLLLCTILLTGCAGSSAASVDRTKLPLGDGKHATSAKKGYIFSCQQSFDSNAPGAQAQGPWIDGTTWDMTAKISVAGTVRRTNVHRITIAGSTRTITGNGLPSVSGTFPVSSSDPAYSYDRNPNTIASYSLSVSVPANPKVAATATCAGGAVGVTTTGIPIYNGFDAGGRDAVANEVQDECGGHPQFQGHYHYHGLSACASRTGLYGYALDGFGIYGPKDQQTHKTLSTKDLDACHGITSTVKWRGKWRRMYHYVATDDFPYTVGCFRGTAVQQAL